MDKKAIIFDDIIQDGAIAFLEECLKISKTAKNQNVAGFFDCILELYGNLCEENFPKYFEFMQNELEKKGFKVNYCRGNEVGQTEYYLLTDTEENPYIHTIFQWLLANRFFDAHLDT